MAQGGKREFTITRIWMNIPIHMDDHLPGHPLTNEVPLITIGTLGFGYYLCRLKRGRLASFARSDSIIIVQILLQLSFISITRRFLL